jgi:putative membrane protein
MASVVIAVLITLLLVLTSPAHAHVPDSLSLTAWHWRPDVLLVLVFFGFIFVRGWLYLRRKSSRVVKSWQLAFYVIGIISIGVALLSPIDALALTLLSMHMVQHLLLLMIAPLCLLLANPLAVVLWGLPAGIGNRAGRLFRRGCFFRKILWGGTLMPVTWSVYVVNLWAWHHPALYQMALRNEWVHDLQHLLFFSTAILFWWPIVNPAPRLHGVISYGYRIIYLVAATLQNTLLGMAISLPERLLYPFYSIVPELQDITPINDQALGGGIMWVSGHMYLIPILVLVARLLKQEEQPY